MPPLPVAPSSEQSSRAAKQCALSQHSDSEVSDLDVLSANTGAGPSAADPSEPEKAPYADPSEPGVSSSVGTVDLPARKRASATPAAAAVQDMAQVEAMMSGLGLKPMTFVRAAGGDGGTEASLQGEEQAGGEEKVKVGSRMAGLGFSGEHVAREAEIVYDRSVDAGEH